MIILSSNLILLFQSVGCSLSVMGFGESIDELTGLDNPWLAKGVAVGLVILLLGNLLFSDKAKKATTKKHNCIFLLIHVI